MTPPRPRPDRELALTRNHLYALGALSLALAVLAFFVGMQVGRGDVPAAAAPPVPPLVSEEVRTGDLEVLLAKVEAAGAGQGQLTFTDELPKTDPGPPPLPDPDAPPPDPNAPPAASTAALTFAPPERPGTATVAPGAAPSAPAAEDIPKGAWAVQVFTRPDEKEAAVLVETLRAAGLAAYRVVALVEGKAVWRVRVGGYASKESASAALSEVSARSGSADAVVTPAP